MRPSGNDPLAAYREQMQQALAFQQNVLKLRQFVQELVNTRATTEDYQNLADIFADIFQDAQEQRLEPDQVKSKMRKTAFAGLAKLLPRDRAELYAFIALLLTILQLVLSLRASTPTITPAQMEEIIERVLDPNEHDPPPLIPPAPPTPPHPPADHK